MGCRLWGHTESDTTEVTAAVAAAGVKISWFLCNASVNINIILNAACIVSIPP